jgi:hypothetical protein
MKEPHHNPDPFVGAARADRAVAPTVSMDPVVGAIRADDDESPAAAAKKKSRLAKIFNAAARHPFLSIFLAAATVAGGMYAKFRYDLTEHQSINYASDINNTELTITKPNDDVAIRHNSSSHKVQVADFDDGKYCEATSSVNNDRMAYVTMFRENKQATQRIKAPEMSYKDASCEPMDTAMKDPAKAKIITELGKALAKSKIDVQTLK